MKKSNGRFKATFPFVLIFALTMLVCSACSIQVVRPERELVKSGQQREVKEEVEKTEQGTEQGNEQGTEQGTEQGNEQGNEQGTEQGTEQGGQEEPVTNGGLQNGGSYNAH